MSTKHSVIEPGLHVSRNGNFRCGDGRQKIRFRGRRDGTGERHEVKEGRNPGGQRTQACRSSIAMDWMVVCAVMREPVSNGEFPANRENNRDF